MRGISPLMLPLYEIDSAPVRAGQRIGLDKRDVVTAVHELRFSRFELAIAVARSSAGHFVDRWPKFLHRVGAFAEVFKVVIGEKGGIRGRPGLAGMLRDSNLSSVSANIGQGVCWIAATKHFHQRHVVDFATACSLLSPSVIPPGNDDPRPDFLTSGDGFASVSIFESKGDGGGAPSLAAPHRLFLAAPAWLKEYVRLASDATMRLDARDPFGNLAPTYAATVTFSSSDTQAILPPVYQFTIADAGSHTFAAPLALRTVGSQWVAVTDNTMPSHLSVTQSNITVFAATAANLVLTLTPNGTTAGTPSSLRVEAHDLYGNIATGYIGTVGFTSTDPQAALPANYSFTSGAAGVHTFTAGVIGRTSGPQTVLAVDTTYSSIRGSTSLSVAPGVATSFVLANTPSQATAGAPVQFKVIAKDAYLNISTGHVGSYTITTSDGAAGISSGLAFSPADQGITTACCVTFHTSGTQTFTATDSSDSTLKASGSVPVGPGALNRYNLQMIGVVFRVGWLSTATLTAYDSFGNVKTDYRGTAHFTSTDAVAHLPADYAFVSSDNGAHSFIHQTIFETVGSLALTASDGSIVSTAPVAVQVAPPSTSPATISVSLLTGAGLQLQWSDLAPGTDSYNVKQGSTYLAQGLPGMSYWVAGLTSGQSYTFTVEAVGYGPVGSVTTTPRTLGQLSETITNTQAAVAPQITVVSPTEKQAVGSASQPVNLSYSSANAAIAPGTLQARLNGTDCSHGGSDVSSSFSPGASSASGTATLARGTNTLVFCIADVVGNVGTAATRTIYYDVSPPSIVITTPAGDAAIVTSFPFQVSGTVSDDDTSPMVTVTVNQTTFPATVTTGAFAVAIPVISGVQPLVQGVNSILATATDRTGRSTSTTSMRLYYYPATGSLNPVCVP